MLKSKFLSVAAATLWGLCECDSTGEIITARFEASRPTADERKVESGPLTRYGWPLEVARAVEFLVTSDSSYVTGQILRVDGGAQLWPS